MFEEILLIAIMDLLPLVLLTWIVILLSKLLKEFRAYRKEASETITR